MRVLVTGGAGFIGSHLVDALLARGGEVRVLDDLSTGREENLLDAAGAELIRGDLRDGSTVREAVEGAELVFHLGALPSVARSVADPIASHEVNATGTLTVLLAARDAGARRVVSASSSSVYGDTPTLPKAEDMPVRPRSPYAAAKLAGEAYCRSAAASLGLETVSLRFFNVFGPRQDPASEYAAVIPRFITRLLAGEGPVIYGDGTQSRDFTYIDNVVRACLLAAEAGEAAVGEAFNVGVGERTSLLDLAALIGDIVGVQADPVFEAPRPGDIRDSQSDISAAGRSLGYRPHVPLREGLERTVRWFASVEQLER